VSSEEVYRKGEAASGIQDAAFAIATRANDQLLTARKFFKESPKESLEYLPILLPAVPLLHFLNALERVDFNLFSSNLQRKSLLLPFKIYLAARSSKI
jgi:NADH dehydrogenase [ubiquinone] 1 alpha subcomplex assembly factor 6